MAKEINNVLVVGAGVMGSGIAQVFAGNGYKTVMADLKEEFIKRAFVNVEKNIAGMKEEGLADDAYAETVRANLSGILNSQIPEKAKDFDLVIEVVPENKEIKKDTYKMLSDNCKEDCIFASNTSGMDVFSVIEEVLVNPERLVITHWFNPPHLMKLIEIVKGPKTSDETAETMREILEKCGKKPAVLNKFMPGFIVNRMATVICRELYYMIDQGWVTPIDAENAIKYTDGLRYSFEGPLELWDFVGLEIPVTVAAGVIPTLCDTDYIPGADQLIEAGKLGVRAGEGMLKKYPSDLDGYAKKRNRRILEMYKMMNKFEEEDKEDILK